MTGEAEEGTLDTEVRFSASKTKGVDLQSTICQGLYIDGTTVGTGFFVRKFSGMGTFTLIALFFPVTILVAMTVITGVDVIAENGADPTHLPIGDWNITEETVVDGTELIVTGNINVGQGATLIITDSIIRVNSSHPHQFTMRVADGATLKVVNSTLHLDDFESEPMSDLDLSGETVINTRGRLLARSHSILTDGVTFNNIAPNVDNDEDGEGAICILNGSVDSAFRYVTIRNRGGHAGTTSPGMNGSAGGASILISNVSTWIWCFIECTAGDSSGGGLRLTNGSGGNGGEGADVSVLLQATFLEDVSIHAFASDGGKGAGGSRNTAGNGGHGGDGAEGGIALVTLESPSILEMFNVTMIVKSGNGGSGANGGEAIDGDGGTAGYGANAGSCIIEISCIDDIFIEDSTFTALGGEGGYGGDYGRNEGGTGSFGIPRPGGYGGDALVEILGLVNMYLEDLKIEVRGGHGLDGGGGYEQGDTGGNGAEGTIKVHAEANVETVGADLRAIGGNGGPGGPAFSEIRGNGGDGGDAMIEFTGLLEMEMDDFTIYVIIGTGGLGRDSLYDGAYGIETLDLETELLNAREGTFNQPLDDLSGNARGYLYNVEFDMEFGIHALPIGDAIVYEVTPVTIRVINGVDPKTSPPWVNAELSVINIDTSDVVAHGFTDTNGECHFNLPFFTYTSKTILYASEYHVLTTLPEDKNTKKSRIDMFSGNYFTILFPLYPPLLFLEIEEPEDGEEYRVYSTDGGLLNTSGYITTDENKIMKVSVQLFPTDEGPGDWPIYILRYSYRDWRGIEPLDRSGHYYPSQEYSNRLYFFLYVPVLGGETEYFNGTWTFKLMVETEFKEYTSEVTFDLHLNLNVGKPWIHLRTSISGRTFNGSKVLIEGNAGDDYIIKEVQVRIDGGDWTWIRGGDEWNYLLDTQEFDDGSHTIDFRALDGIQYTAVIFNVFEVEKVTIPEGNNDDDIDGGDGWTLEDTLLVTGLGLLIIGILLLVALAIVKARKGPDS